MGQRTTIQRVLGSGHDVTAFPVFFSDLFGGITAFQQLIKCMREHGESYLKYSLSLNWTQTGTGMANLGGRIIKNIWGTTKMGKNTGLASFSGQTAALMKDNGRMGK